MPDSPNLAIGLMSGTSLDGVDGVLLSLQSFHQIAIQDTAHIALPAALREPLAACLRQPTIHLDQLGQLDSQLSLLYAQVANQLKPRAGKQTVAVIGCHGQTIRHRPDDEFPFSMQLGNGALVAQRTGLPLVNDFRSADIAVGGQGAPLATAFHHAIFTSRDENRAVLNLGGIANITHLPSSDPRDPDPRVRGFDTGPANALLDGWCQRHFKRPFDDAGDLAAGGAVHQKFLKKLLTDPYFSRPPPKSTGREYFNQAWLAQVCSAEPEFAGLAPADVQATLTALSAESVAQQLHRLTPPPDVVYVCGGGIRNKTLLAMLRARCDCAVRSTAELGVDPQWVEAAAFAWLAYKTLHRATATLPSVTGARKPTIAGAIYFPD